MIKVIKKEEAVVMSSNQDFVDKIFSTSYKWAQKGLDVVDSTSHSVLQSVNGLKDTILDPANSDVFPPEAVTTRGIFHNILPGLNSLEPIKDNWMYGLSISATTLLIIWKCRQLLAFPDHVPQTDSRCVLILGDMNDPIVRSQVMDLYRRGFNIFICSENANNFKQFEEETDFIHPINPSSNDDLIKFTDFLTKPNYPPRKLSSILFMPNLSYQPAGDLSVDAMQYELRSSILIYYNTLMKLLPYLPDPQTQLILFNPSLSYNLQSAHHPTEIFISGFISSIYRSLSQYKSLSVVMVHLGLFQVRGQLSNYKHMNLTGSDISTSLHSQIYKLIIRFNGNAFQKFTQYVSTFGGRCQIYYFGRYSYISTIAIFPSLLNLQKFAKRYLEIVKNYLKDKYSSLRLK